MVYWGCWARIGSNGWRLCCIMLGQNISLLVIIVKLRCLKSWIILKFKVNLLGPSIFGWGCWSMFVVDHRLF